MRISVVVPDEIASTQNARTSGHDLPSAATQMQPGAADAAHVTQGTLSAAQPSLSAITEAERAALELGKNTMLIAAAHNDQATVLSLLEAGISPDCQEEHGEKMTPLMYAAVNKNYVLAEAILKKISYYNLNVYTRTNLHGQTAFILACKHNNTDFLRLLFEVWPGSLEIYGRSDNVETFKSLAQYRTRDSIFDKEGLNGLMHIIQGKDANALAFYLERITGNQLTLYSLKSADTGRNAYLHAAYVGNLDALKALATHLNDQEKNVRDNEGNNAFLLAASQGHHTIVSYLYEAEKTLKDSCNKKQENALMLACKHGRVNVVNVLVVLPVTPIISPVDTLNNTTPLMYAAAANNIHIMQRLLFSRNFNGDEAVRRQYINKKNLDIDSALTIACQHNHVEAARYLVEQGAEIHDFDSKGLTPLMHAARLGDLAFVRQLLAHRSIKNLHQFVNAQTNPKFPLAKARKEHQSCTALHLAARGGYVAIIKLLLSLGADASLHDASYNTPQEVASEAHKQEVTQLLEQKPRRWLPSLMEWWATKKE